MAPIPLATEERLTDDIRACRSCGTHVSDDFARVFGDNHDRVDRCPSCTNVTDLLDGGAVDK